MNTEVPNVGANRSKHFASSKDTVRQQRTRTSASFTDYNTQIFKCINAVNGKAVTRQLSFAVYIHTLSFLSVYAQGMIFAEIIKNIHESLQVLWCVCQQYNVISKQHDEKLHARKTKQERRLPSLRLHAFMIFNKISHTIKKQ